MSGLQVSALSHAYDNEDVVNDVSVMVAPGELVCLLGPSGCGKTTLLRVAAGLEDLQKGKVHIGEMLVANSASHFNMPPEKRGIGLMFQDYALFPHLTITQNILFGVTAKSSHQNWLTKSLHQMGLTAYADSYPHTLSGGQQQRVALLRAIAPEPRVLFLDEPFSGLDVTRRAETREQTLTLLKETGVATLMVTHDPEEAMSMADRIVVMNRGRMVQDGTPEDIYFRPNSAFVTDLFGTVNRLKGVVNGGRIKTALGIFEAPHFSEGEPVDVMIRPDGIRLADQGGKPAIHAGDAPCKPAPAMDAGFEVINSRSLGRASRIVIQVPQIDGSLQLIETRVPGTFTPPAGSRVSATVNRNDAHIFKSE